MRGAPSPIHASVVRTMSILTRELSQFVGDEGSEPVAAELGEEPLGGRCTAHCLFTLTARRGRRRERQLRGCDPRSPACLLAQPERLLERGTSGVPIPRRLLDVTDMPDRIRHEHSITGLAPKFIGAPKVAERCRDIPTCDLVNEADLKQGFSDAPGV